MNKFYKGYDDITASDAFKGRMVRTLQSEMEEEAPRKTVHLPIRRRTFAILIAAAITVLAIGTAAAATIIARRDYSPVGYMTQSKDEREQSQNVVPDVENAIASAKPESGKSSVTMLPEMKDATELNVWRQKMGQPVYSEGDWGWIREIRPEIEEVLVDGTALVFNVRLNTDHGMCFAWGHEGEGQHLDVLCDDATISFEKNGQRFEQLMYAGTGINADSVSEDGATLYSEIELDDLSEPLPTDGTVQVTMTIGIYDKLVDNMAHIGELAYITYSFAFDASAGADIAEPIVTERALSGSVVLTLEDRNGREYNERVSLDGVVLLETLNFRSTGVYVTYRIKSAPEGWTDAHTLALMQPSFESAGHYGLTVACAPKGSANEDEILLPGYPSGGVGREYVGILPIFPSDYERVKAGDWEIRLGYRYVAAFNDAPVGEDWHIPPKAGVDYGYDLLTAVEPIASFDLKLP